MLRELEVLTPSLVVCAAFLIGVVMFLRRQMSAKPQAEDDAVTNIPDDRRNAADVDQQQPSSGQRMTH